MKAIIRIDNTNTNTDVTLFKRNGAYYKVNEGEWDYFQYDDYYKPEMLLKPSSCWFNGFVYTKTKNGKRELSECEINFPEMADNK